MKKTVKSQIVYPQLDVDEKETTKGREMFFGNKMKFLSILGQMITDIWDIFTFALKWGTIFFTAIFVISIFRFEDVQNSINFFKNIF